MPGPPQLPPLDAKESPLEWLSFSSSLRERQVVPRGHDHRSGQERHAPSGLGGLSHPNLWAL